MEGSSFELAWMSSRPLSCIPGFKSIRHEDVLRVLPYTDMAIILVIWPVPVMQTSNRFSYRDSIYKVALIGPAVFENIFSSVDSV